MEIRGKPNVISGSGAKIQARILDQYRRPIIHVRIDPGLSTILRVSPPAFGSFHCHCVIEGADERGDGFLLRRVQHLGEIGEEQVALLVFVR